MKRNHRTKQEIQRRDLIDSLSRRDFLSLTAKAGTAGFVLPTFFNALFQSTNALALEGTRGQMGPCVVQIHMQGGPLASACSAAPTDLNGEILPANLLGQYGVNPQTVAIRELFGTRFFNRSGRNGDLTNPDVNATNSIDFYDELAARAAIYGTRTAWVDIANNSKDDNGTNPCGLTNLAQIAGFQSPELVPSVGLATTASGMGNNTFLSGGSNAFVPRLASDLPSQYRYATSLPTDTSKIGLIATAIRDLAGLNLDQSKMPAETSSAVTNTMQKNLSYVNATAPANSDPLSQLGAGAPFEGCFGLTANTAQNDPNYRFAMGLSLMLRGATNFVGFTFGNMDYHQQAQFGNNGTRERDRRVGRFWADIAQVVARSGLRDTFIIITSDGCTDGIADETAAVVAKGDRGIYTSFSMAFVAGKSSSLGMFSKRSPFIGGKDKGNGTSVTTTLSGKNDMTAAIAIASNILHVSGVPDGDIVKMLGLSDIAQLISMRALQLG